MRPLMAKPRKVTTIGDMPGMTLSSSMLDTLDAEVGDYLAVEEQDGQLVIGKASIGVDDS